MKELKVTWEQVEDFVDYIGHRYEDEHLTGVYGPPRGGSVLAVMISHRMNIPMLAAPAKGCLIVDDICDSGKSMLHYNETRDKLKYQIVTMFYKDISMVQPNTFWGKVDDDIWVVFPWEELNKNLHTSERRK